MGRIYCLLMRLLESQLLTIGLNRFFFSCVLAYSCCAASWAPSQPLAGQATPKATTQSSASTREETLWLQANGLRLKTRIYWSTKSNEHPILILVLHGDSPFGPPSYQYAFARQAAEKMEDVVVAALLRPGYRDDAGDQSEGVRG